MNGRGDVLVLGAGSCGLSAAWDLLEKGYKVTVLEVLGEPGGLCRTSERGDYRFDLGGHRFISRDQGLIDRVQKLMGSELLVSTRKSVIRFQGKNYKYPLNARDLLVNMNPLLSSACFLSYVKSRLLNRLNPQPDDNFEEWLVNRYGRRLYQIFFEPYSTKLWGVSPREISSEWASQRISLLNLSDVILRVLGLRKSKPRTYALKYFYPREGIGQMFRVLAAEVERLGGMIVYNARVTAVNLEGDTVTSVEYELDGVKKKIECEKLISTLLLPDLVKMMHPKPAAEVLAMADDLKLRSLRFMNIPLDGIEDISDNTWWYLQDGGYAATRLQEPKRRSRYSAPEGKTSVMLEIPCTVGDETWTMDDKKLFERCMVDLKDMGLDLEDNVVDYYTTDAIQSYPVYSMTYRQNRDGLLEHLKKYGNLISCGRQGLFDYIFMDDAMLMGFQASEIVQGRQEHSILYDRLQDPDLLEVKSKLPDGGYE
ncbi:MAG: NAD(P)-binding protein [Candidatus Altiarchaeales archaeon]|nr:NAD(P)-binding protein [Candidatus Altiarchaeales archaeon]MBD3416454.1 NAD(P)-binding protein [Candidatus Altiarchaeales archaeon]